MKTVKSVFKALLILSLMMIPNGLVYAQIESPDQEEENGILIGRISHIEGQLLRYVPEEDDWVATVKDTPFGIDDVLYTTFEGRAEIKMPNNTMARIDSDTQIQLVVLNKDTTEIDLSSGKARLDNKSSNTVIKATTPFGYVMAPPETRFDLYVGENAVEAIALRGTVYFVHNASDTKHEVIAGSTSIHAGSTQVTASERRINSSWDRWNKERDTLWAERMREKGESAGYLPPALHDDAHVLENHGRWERVHYDGGYYFFWRPIYVSVGWTPFTVGRWTVCYGDKIWIPHEPFGYVTHHYGNWIFTRGYWYWAPPVTRRMIHTGLPLLNIGFGWYPGRVAWIHYGANIGWIPLAPYEPYYCHRYWGRRSIVMSNFRRARHHYKTKRYKHHRRAVIIHRNHFYRVNNYSNVRIRNISHTTVINRYCNVPVINKTVINNHRTYQKRHYFSNAPAKQKQRNKVIKEMNRKHAYTRKKPSTKTETIREGSIHSSRHKRAGNRGRKSYNDHERVDGTKQIDKANASSRFKGKRHERNEKSLKQNAVKTQRPMQRFWAKRPHKPAKPQMMKREYQRVHKKAAKQRHAKKPPLPERNAQHAGVQSAKGSGQRTEAGGRMLEGKRRTAEIRGQRTDRMGRKSGIRGRRSEGSRRTTNDRRLTAVFTGNAKR